jgi:hypothetical protein
MSFPGHGSSIGHLPLLTRQVSCLSKEERNLVQYSTSNHQKWHPTVRTENYFDVHLPKTKYQAGGTPFVTRSATRYSETFAALPLEGAQVDTLLRKVNMEKGKGDLPTALPGKFGCDGTSTGSTYRIPRQSPPDKPFASSNDVTNTIPRGSDELLETRSNLHESFPPLPRMPSSLIPPPRPQMGYVNDFPNREMDEVSNYNETFTTRKRPQLLEHRPDTMMIPEDDSSRVMSVAIPAKVSSYIARHKSVKNMPPVRQILTNSFSSPQLGIGAMGGHTGKGDL